MTPLLGPVGPEAVIALFIMLFVIAAIIGVAGAFSYGVWYVISTLTD